MVDELSECAGWFSGYDVFDEAEELLSFTFGLLGLPLGSRSLTPGRCDLAPTIVREAMASLSSFDLDSDYRHLSAGDFGSLPLKLVSPEESFDLIIQRFNEVQARSDFQILLGGNNSITRPGVAALAASHPLGLSSIGLVTLDAHFDLRDLDCGLTNGNPVRALLGDGLPGRNIAQIGIQPFANTQRMKRVAQDNGITFFAIDEVEARGIEVVVDEVLTMLNERTEAIYLDVDIDVVDRAFAPGAPGARPGGITPGVLFRAVRRLAAHPKVKVMDVVEFDPSTDVNQITALMCARCVMEFIASKSKEAV